MPDYLDVIETPGDSHSLNVSPVAGRRRTIDLESTETDGLGDPGSGCQPGPGMNIYEPTTGAWA